MQAKEAEAAATAKAAEKEAFEATQLERMRAELKNEADEDGSDPIQPSPPLCSLPQDKRTVLRAPGIIAYRIGSGDVQVTRTTQHTHLFCGYLCVDILV